MRTIAIPVRSLLFFRPLPPAQMFSDFSLERLYPVRRSVPRPLKICRRVYTHYQGSMRGYDEYHTNPPLNARPGLARWKTRIQ